MPDTRTAYQRAIDEFTRMEKPDWSNENWPRVLAAFERGLKAYQRHAVMMALEGPQVEED